MKLYYSPGACSLADHIALHEAGLAFEHERVDLNAKKTEHGDDYTAINPKGYVPALRLDDGELLTENVAVLDWIADQSATLKPHGPLGRTRQLEMLTFVTSEIHKSFKPLFAGGTDEEKGKAREQVAKRLAQIAKMMPGEYLLGDTLSVADCYLFVMLLWSGKNDIAVPAPLEAFRDRMMTREAVQKAMRHEGLIKN